ncbi:MAG: hypothetical protein EKK37_12310 [Sphingobacteriales bacterium]|nr:MAG: hypothetical protein EKK37_12310 [Sphingobacteriales bacterium]
MIDVFIYIDSSKYSSELTEEQKLFPDLTLLQKYDAVLDVLYSESGKAPTFDDINAALLKEKKKVHWGEVMDILYTMIGDDYVYGHFTKKDATEKDVQIFLLSFKGKLVKETDGYAKKLEREKTKTDLTNRQLTASISSVNWSKANILIGLLLAATTLLFVISNWNINNKTYHRILDRDKTDSIEQSERQQSESKLNKVSLRVSLSQEDTVKVKIVK